MQIARARVAQRHCHCCHIFTFGYFYSYTLSRFATVKIVLSSSSINVHSIVIIEKSHREQCLVIRVN